eukprot:365983-Chlamydomonas_euryale.AAC.19
MLWITGTLCGEVARAVRKDQACTQADRSTCGLEGIEYVPSPEGQGSSEHVPARDHGPAEYMVFVSPCSSPSSGFSTRRHLDARRGRWTLLTLGPHQLLRPVTAASRAARQSKTPSFRFTTHYV